MAKFKHLVTKLKISHIYKEINIRVKSGKASYHSVQNIMPPPLQSKIVKIYIKLYFYLIIRTQNLEKTLRSLV